MSSSNGLQAARSRFRSRVAHVLSLALLTMGLTPIAIDSAHAETSASPDLSVSVSAPSSALAGSNVSFDVTAKNLSSSENYNLAASMLVPAGASFVSAPRWGAPKIYAPGSLTSAGSPYPAAGYQLWVWEDVADLPASASWDDSVTLTAPPGPAGQSSTSTSDSSIFPVGSNLAVQTTLYSSTDPRYLPVFIGSSGVSTPEASSATKYSSTDTTSVLFSALSVKKSQSTHSSDEFLRGVHDQSGVFKINVQATSLSNVTGVSVVDYLPASFEFLGCGNADYSQTDWSPSDPVVNEYPTSPSLLSSPAVSNCTLPDSVDTIVADASTAASNALQVGAVYTKVTWNLGTLPASSSVNLYYRAAVPLYENALFASPLATTAPAGTLPPQAANLDNNTGPSTRQGTLTANLPEWSNGNNVNDGRSVKNIAVASGHYEGLIFQGTSRSVSASGTWVGTIMDASLSKTVDTTSFHQGGRALYTLTIRTGEYANLDSSTITDKVPNGLCPSVPSGTPWEGTRPSECATAEIANAQVVKVATQPDGSMLLYLNPLFPDGTLSANSTFSIEYEATMRTSYQDASAEYGPTTSGDGFDNQARLAGSTTPKSSLTSFSRETGPLYVWDDASSGIGTGYASISKKVLERAAVTSDPSDPCAAGSSWVKEADGFHLGDTVCFELKVSFPSDIYTRNASITDFLPANLDFGGYAVSSASHGADVAAVQVSGQRFSMDIGSAGPGGDRYVPAGSLMVVHLWGKVNESGVRQATLQDKTSNLLKYRQNSVNGKVFFLRDQADFKVDPAPLSLVKGVQSIKDSTGVTSSVRPAASQNAADGAVFGSNRDGITALEGETVRYRVDLSASYPVSSTVVWDALPQGIKKTDVSSISAGGQAFNPGDPGYPNVVPSLATRSIVLWNSLAVNAAGATLNYDVKIPVGIGIQSTLSNTAYVTSYQSSVNGSNIPQAYIPDAGPDASLVGNTVSTGTYDSSLVSLPTASVVDQTFSEIYGTSFNDQGVTSPQTLSKSTQAVKGEWTTFAYSVSIPAHTSVKSATLTGALPTASNWTVDPTATKLYVDGTLMFPNGTGNFNDPVNGALLNLNSATGTLTFPSGTFSNTSNSPRVYSVYLSAYVKSSASWTHSTTTPRTHVATFTSTGISPLVDSASMYLVAPAPSITKTHNDADAIVAAGQVVTYTLTASNAASRPTSFDTVVTDCVPSGLSVVLGTIPVGSASASSDPSCVSGTLITWSLGSLPASASYALTYQATVAPAAAAGVAYVNNAKITGYTLGSSASSRRAALTATATKTITTAAPVVTKTVSNASPSIGQEVTYTVNVTVPANVNMYLPHLDDLSPAGLKVSSINVTLPSGVSYRAGSSQPTGASGSTASTLSWLFEDISSNPSARTIVLTYKGTVLNASALSNGTTLANTAYMYWSTAPTGGSVLNKSASALLTVKEPSLSVVKDVNSVSTYTADPGETFVYHIKVTNTGTSTAYEPVISDVSPAGITLNPSSLLSANLVSNPDGSATITWSLSPLAPGASTTVTYSARLDNSQNIDDSPKTNTANVSYSSHNSSAGFDPTQKRAYSSAPSSAKVTPKFPSLNVSKTSSAPITDLGKPLSFTLNVSNPGASSAYGAVVRDSLPAGFELVGTPTLSAGTAVFSTSGQDLIWSFSSSLTAGSNVTITYQARPALSYIWSESNTGSNVKHRNTVQVSAFDGSGAFGWGSSVGSSHPYQASSYADVSVARSDLSLTKAPVGSFVAGQEGSWNLVVSNASGVDAETGPITVVDTLPSSVDVSSAHASGTGWSISSKDTSSGRVTLTHLGPLPSGASLPVVTLSALIDPNTPNATTITNTAHVSGITFETNTSNNDSSASVSVSALADLAVSVSTPSSYFTPGTNQVFTIGVNNLGPSTSLSGMKIKVSLPQGMNPVSAELTGQGWSCTPVDMTALTSECAYNGGNLLVSSSTPLLNLQGQIYPSWTAPLVAQAYIVYWATPEPPGPGPQILNNRSQATISTVHALADLSVVKTSSESSVPAGGKVSFSLNVTNSGPSDASNVVVTDHLPTGMSLVASSVSPAWVLVSSVADASGTTVKFSFINTSFASNSSSILNYEVDVSPSLLSTVTNEADVYSPTPDPIMENNHSSLTLPVDARADLAVTFSPNASYYTSGTSFQWSAVVANNGPAVSRAGFEVLIPYSSAYHIDLAQGFNWSCAPDASGWRCSYGANLNPNESTSPILVDVTVRADWTLPLEGDATITAWHTLEPTGKEYYTLNNTSHAVVVDSRQEADLALDKYLDQPALTPGEDATYSLRVRNFGPSDAQNVTVSDVLPAGLRFVEDSTSSGWSGHTISTDPTGATTVVFVKTSGVSAAGTDETLTYKTHVDAASVSSLTNFAFVSTTTLESNYSNNAALVTNTPKPEADLAVKVRPDGPQKYVSGTSYPWVVTVTNNGPSVSQAPFRVVLHAPNGVQLQVPAPADGWSCVKDNEDLLCSYSAPNVAPTESAAPLRFETNIPSWFTSDISLSSSIVYWTTPEPLGLPQYTSNNTDASAVVPGSQIADLSVSKTLLSDTLLAGEDALYEISVTNLGPSDAQSVEVADTLPALMSLSSFDSSDPWVQSGSDASFTLGRPLASGETSSLKIMTHVEPSALGQMTNLVQVSTSTPESDLANNSASAISEVKAFADLAVLVTPAASSYTSGNFFDWSVGVSNLGPALSRTPFQLRVTLPDGVSPDTFKFSGDSWSCTQTQTDPHSLLCAYDGENLNVGSSASALKISAKVLPSWTGELFLKGEMVSWSTPEPDGSAEVSNNTDSALVLTGTQSADLSVTKEQTSKNLTPGLEAPYLVKIKNSGPSDALNVTVTDILPEGLVFDHLDAGSQWSMVSSVPDPSGQSITFKLESNSGTLPADSESSLSYWVKLSSSLKGTVTNKASVSSTTSDPDNTNNSTSVSDDVKAEADLEVQKSASVSSATVGSKVTYVVKVTNLGPSDAPVEVVDTPSEGLTFDPQSSVFSDRRWSASVDADGILHASLNGDLVAGGMVSFETTMMVEQKAFPAVKNTATVTSTVRETSYSNNTSSFTLSVLSPDLSLTKSVNMASAKVGDTLTYTIKVANHGTAPATTLTIVDSLPSGVTFESASWQDQPSQGSCSFDGAVTCSYAGSLAVGASMVAVVKVKINKSVTGAVINQASVVTPGEHPSLLEDNTAWAKTSLTPPRLSQTGVDVGPVGLISLMLVSVGSLLLLWRRRASSR